MNIMEDGNICIGLLKCVVRVSGAVLKSDNRTSTAGLRTGSQALKSDKCFKH